MLTHMLTLTPHPSLYPSQDRERELWAAPSSSSSYLKLDSCSLQDSLLGSSYSAHEQLGSVGYPHRKHAHRLSVNSMTLLSSQQAGLDMYRLDIQ